jgi:CheB methylesterase
MPADTGMGFVVVTHQHPGHTSLLPELLGKCTDLKVVPATDGLRVKPNCVYVGPPDGQLAIVNSFLHRRETSEKREAPRLPIDYFFRSLAEDHKEKAICIILSGTGTDGTLGLKAIKGESGMGWFSRYSRRNILECSAVRWLRDSPTSSYRHQTWRSNLWLTHAGLTWPQVRGICSSRLSGTDAENLHVIAAADRA